MKKRELKVFVDEYARAVQHARELGEIKRSLINDRAAQVERKIEKAQEQARESIEEHTLQTRAKADEFERLVNELMKGE